MPAPRTFHSEGQPETIQNLHFILKLCLYRYI